MKRYSENAAGSPEVEAEDSYELSLRSCGATIVVNYSDYSADTEDCD